jgi:hypothetical protein
MTMEVWALILLFGVLVEALIQVVKGWAPETATVPGWLWPVASAVIGIAMCVTAKADALTALGVEITVPYIGYAVTGLLVSRGSNFLHDFWDRIKNAENVPDQ